jgi:ribosomal protein L7/L12
MDDATRKGNTVLPLPAAAVSALQRGNKIEAIKIVRAERNIGLKEAKDEVEEYLRGQPALQSARSTAQSEANRNVLLWLAALIGMAMLGYYFLISP